MSEQWILGLSVLSVVMFVVSLVALPWIVAKIPADYFLHDSRTATDWHSQRPLIRWLILIGKNLLGIMLLVGGIIMIFVPGQGILTMAMGLVLMDYPGKFRLERWIVSHPKILGGLNWLRKLRHAEPLEVEGKTASK